MASRPPWTSLALALLVACGDEATPAGESGSSSGESSGASTFETQVSSDASTSEGVTSDDGGDSGASTSDASGGSSSSSTTSHGETSAETSSAGSTEEGSSSTDETTTSAGTTDDSTESGTSGDDDGGEVDPECPLSCDPPCELVLSEGIANVVSMQHDGERFVARDSWGKIVLRDAETLEVLYVEHDTAWAELAPGVLAVAYDDGSVVMRSSADFDVLGESTVQWQRGLAVDGSYLWSAGTDGIEVVGIDGAPIWSMVGDFGLAQVLALPDSLHVFSETYAEESVLHVDLLGGATDEAAFEGSFAGWFGDNSRFFVDQGMAYRLYESDGTELAFGLGRVIHGWGDHAVVNGEVVHVSDVDTPLLALPSGYFRRSGPALAVHGDPSTIVVLDPAGPEQQDFPPTSVIPTSPYDWEFAWSSSGWVIGRDDGMIADQLDRTMSMGPIDRVDAALAGRFALQQPGALTEIWDVVPDCTVEPVAELALPGGARELSPDGSVVAHGVPSPEFLDNGHQTLLQQLPGGEEIGYFGNSSCSTCFIQSWSMADDASVVAHLWSWGFATNAVFEVPSGAPWAGTNSNVMPAIAPGGAHVVVTDAPDGTDATYEDAVAYVYEGDTFVDVFDGVAWGFVDDEHVLLSHYESAGFCSIAGACDDYLSTDIVALDGSVIQATSLPDVRAFQRISDTEILVLEPPRIYDVYSSELLWSMSDVEFAGAISPDLVVWSDRGSLGVHRWR